MNKSQGVQTYTDECQTDDQIADILKSQEKIFMATLCWIIPCGVFLRKKPAEEKIRSEVKNKVMRRKMFRFLELIPEKKSVLSTQKALQHRDIEDIMRVFADLGLPPVTHRKAPVHQLPGKLL